MDLHNLPRLPLTVSRLTVLLWVGLAVAGVAVLVRPTVSLPADERGLLRPFVTPELTPAIRISQQFRMTGPGLWAVEFQPIAIGPVSGDLRLELHDVTGHDDVLLSGIDVRATDVVRTRRYRFEFTPVPESTSRFYQLDLTSPTGNPAHGVAVWATKGGRYRGGAMLVDGVPRWADLAFRALAPDPSAWELLMQLPALRRDVVLAALAGGWIALGVVMHMLVHGRSLDSDRAHRMVTAR